MKACQLKISLLHKKKEITRTLLLSKKTTYENLHEMIQILFNLDGCEFYSFKVKDKRIERDHQHSENKTLLRIKENEIIYYDYDLIDSLHFKIEVLESVNTEIVPICIATKGKNLYEGVDGLVESKYQSDVDLEWINHSLSYFQKSDSFLEEVKKVLTQLTKIRFFQDYMHNQIVKIRLPQNKVIYMGCDASEDLVLNFHINANKLLEYTDIHPQSISQSIIKYHDCIECTMLKRTKGDEIDDFDFNIGQYGVFVSYANVFLEEQIPFVYRALYVEALKKYVKVIEFCQKNNVKYSIGKMMEINSKDEVSQVPGKMKIYQINFLGEELCQELVKMYPLVDSSVEIDVLTFPKGENHLETKVIVGDEIHGFLEQEIFNASLKTMLVQILVLLQKRWECYGMDQVWKLRDTHLIHEFEKIAPFLGVKILHENRLEGIDEAYIFAEKRNDLENLNPQEIIMQIMEELGIDLHDVQQVEISKDDLLKKIQAIKDSKKYN